LGDRDRLPARAAVVLKWVTFACGELIPPGGSGLGANIGEPGSCNLGRRGELACGDVRNRADDNARRSAEKADGE
jgi:hypothetical protein